jgi:chemotaxis protein methyltransferase CheR
MTGISGRDISLGPPGAAQLRIPGRTLELVRDLVQAHAGMTYDEGRLHFLQDRIAPLALERGFESLLDYYYFLKYDAEAEREWSRVIDAIAVQETYFWRESDQIRALVRSIIPSLIAGGRQDVRIWSMPCASGEEPLSIAMAIDEAGLHSRAAIEIQASDASERVLQRARAGVYGERAFRQLPGQMRERYFTPLAGGDWAVSREVHDRVRSWTCRNAVRPEEWGTLANADVIFCRNLFIYFDAPTVRRVVAAFAARMRRPGYLCIAAAESLLRLDTPFAMEDVDGAFVYVCR